MRTLNEFHLDNGDTELLFILESYNLLQVAAFYLKHEEDCTALVQPVFAEVFCKDKAKYNAAKSRLLTYMARVLRNDAQAYYVTKLRNVYDSIEDWEGLCSEGEQ